MNISWIGFKTVVLYGAKSWDTGKTDHTGIFDTGNNSRVCHQNQLFLKLWIFQLLCIPFVRVHSFPRQQTIFEYVIFLGIFSLSLECM